jgi:hypothetical protein
MLNMGTSCNIQKFNGWTVFRRPLALRLEIEMFKNKKGKVMAELSNENWLWDLALLCDISHHINN